ncbi:hypothetical protein [Pseudoalteromonas piscicida]|uniref:Uncharacterized protein n=1 Tax=Pseudoalteromonas piscicida TaxID=43662 RepID=A0A2A5JW30_PSEO7|nr:hypothetical protein [Pseudoalteromonas piscicida]PCK33672.1 hypothetical protein CEX98_00660 [Pseudoalteromonas piscicida]
MEKIAIYVEQQKVALDYIKHLTTLSTGSILLLTLLLEKFFSTPNSEWLVLLTFGCFTGAILFLSFAAFGVLLSIRGEVKSSVQHFTAISFIIGIICFIVALISLSGFALVNWWGSMK